MADQNYLIANPTAAEVVVTGANPTTVPAAGILVVACDDTTNEVEQFLAGGCSVQRSDVGTENQRQQGGFMLHMMNHVG
jgi:hypothetical protein